MVWLHCYKGGYGGAYVQVLHKRKLRVIPIWIIWLHLAGEKKEFENHAGSDIWKPLQQIDFELTSHETPQHNNLAELSFPCFAWRARAKAVFLIPVKSVKLQRSQTEAKQSSMGRGDWKMNSSSLRNVKCLWWCFEVSYQRIPTSCPWPGWWRERQMESLMEDSMDKGMNSWQENITNLTKLIHQLQITDGHDSILYCHCHQ